MTELMSEVFRSWFAEHPGGQYTIAWTNAKPLTPEKARHHFNQTMLRSKWERVRGFYVFRHSFASNLAAAEIDQRIIDEWMGHQRKKCVNDIDISFPKSNAAN